MVIVGDVNATLACSVTARKEHVRVAHVEAGLRSKDWGMPEEVNRVVTDRVSNLLFTTDDISSSNLKAEGAAAETIHQVGNSLI